MRTKIFIFGLSLFCIFVFSQSVKYTYYVEFTNSNNKPAITKIGKTTKSIAYNDNQYEVIQYEEAFSNFTTESLRNTSLIEFKTLNDFNNFVFNNRNNIVKYEKIETIDNPILLEKSYNKFKKGNKKNLSFKKFSYTPNDYYLFPADSAHSYLDLINAKEAWDYSKGDNVIVGVADTGFRLTHQEFSGKMSGLPGQTVTNTDDHGNVVAGLAGAKTDNNFGNSSIGFNNQLLVTTNWSWNSLKQLSDNGARAINMSWLNSCSFIQTDQNAINEIYANGTVLVAAAGNSSCGSSYAKVFPASYDNVIAVSGVGHYREIGGPITTNVKDVHYGNYAILENRLQNNEDVDIVAPAFDMDGLPYSGCDTCLYKAWVGTSLASPLVAGAVSLLFSSNGCLSPLEIETILKLTSANIDQLAPNQIFAGLLGAGRLDAGKANKMAWQMNPANGGEILIENKNFTRWNFELLNSAEYIKIHNESFTGTSNVNFKAKKGITLATNTLLQPGTGKNHYLYVENIDTCSDFNKSNNLENKAERKVTNIQLPKSNIKLYPNPSKDYINIQTEGEIHRIDIYDLSGKILKTSYSNSKVNIENLPKGNYLVKIQLVNENAETIKFTKN
ncbi:S8 family serine peptidase [Epilithonimonas sp.]|uniref:S8 family serine peptidase n=1 Tax=Epilithonimonas sp. TaxID=2894511 RepID=UPI0028A1F693|nr:S8 family serine peptidase [Epilithonimonas sp.]